MDENAFILVSLQACNNLFESYLSHVLLSYMQAANIDAEASGINDGEYQLTKHEFSSLGRGKYSGKLFFLFF